MERIVWNATGPGDGLVRRNSPGPCAADGSVEVRRNPVARARLATHDAGRDPNAHPGPGYADTAPKWLR